MTLTKVQAYGNDFLYADAVQAGSPDASARSDWAEVARRLCERHTGVGADGLIVYLETARGASMRLFNADGSPSEVSGNGVRGLAALLAWRHDSPPATECVVETEAGPKALVLIDRQGARFTCRANMGHPSDVRRLSLDVGDETVAAVALRVGNPQCVVLEPHLDESRYRRLGPLLERHPAFPQRTNVEFAEVVPPGTVRILIWERGVGPTLASGTGACAAAVAAMQFGGASRSVDVVSVGGSQRVDWTDDGLSLTGWAEIVWEGRWIP